MHCPKVVQALDFQTTRGKRRLDRWAWADYGQCALLLGDLRQATTAYRSSSACRTTTRSSPISKCSPGFSDALQSRDDEVAQLLRDGIALLDP